MKTTPTFQYLYEARLEGEQRKNARHLIARELDFYRTFRHGSKAARLSGRADDCFTAETADGPVALYPVVATTTEPGIGRSRPRLSVKWRVGVEVTIHGGRWHPPESDEQIIVDAADSIGKALLLADHALELFHQNEAEAAHWHCREVRHEKSHPMREAF